MILKSIVVFECRQVLVTEDLTIWHIDQIHGWFCKKLLWLLGYTDSCIAEMELGRGSMRGNVKRVM